MNKKLNIVIRTLGVLAAIAAGVFAYLLKGKIETAMIATNFAVTDTEIAAAKEFAPRMAEITAKTTTLLTKKRERITELRTRIGRIPYLDPIDLRFRNRVKVPVPTSKAVMFCLMDVSGSMTQATKDLAERARAIVAARPVETTLQLAKIVEGCLPRQKPGQSNPATRTFQALRIAVNDEYGQLAGGLMAAERALRPGGQLAVVTFHSVEDRMVKRFFQIRSGGLGNANRYAPQAEVEAPGFEMVVRKAVAPDEDELSDNPRARSAKLRVGRRTEAPAKPVDRGALGMPLRKGERK